jgi:hypothetical protein
MKVTIETQKNKCGNEYLDTGEMTITSVNEFTGLIELKSDGFKVVCSMDDLVRALGVFYNSLPTYIINKG